MLVQETQSAKDINITCSKMLPIKATTCLQVGPMSLDWPVDPFARSDFSRSSLSPGVPSGEQQRGAFPASTRFRWRQDALQAQPQILQRTTGWDVVPILYCLVASAESIHIGARDSASEVYLSDLLQDVPNQGHHMLTGGAHVSGLAAGSDCKIRSIQTFLLA